jgi:hypothetical protein
LFGGESFEIDSRKVAQPIELKHVTAPSDEREAVDANNKNLDVKKSRGNTTLTKATFDSFTPRRSEKGTSA